MFMGLQTERKRVSVWNGHSLEVGDGGMKCPDLRRSVVSAFTVTVDQSTEGEEL